MSVDFKWDGEKAIVEGHELSAIEALELANQFAGAYDDIVRVARAQMELMPGKMGKEKDDPYAIAWPGKAASGMI